MSGHRHRSQRRTGEHHHDIARRDAAALGYELGLAWMLKADPVKLLLADWPGDDSAGRAGSCQAHRQLERIERAMRASDAGMARDVALGCRHLDQRQRVIERRIGLSRI